MIPVPCAAVELQAALDRYAALPGALGHGLSQVGRIDVSVGRMIDCPLQILDAHEGPARADLVWSQPLAGNADGLGRGRVEHVLVHAILGLRHAKVPYGAEAGIQAGLLLEGSVELDRVVVDVAGRVAHVEKRQEAGGVPCGAGGQLVPFREHDLVPAGAGEVIGDRGADGAAADHQDLDVGFHRARFRLSLSRAL